MQLEHMAAQLSKISKLEK